MLPKLEIVAFKAIRGHDGQGFNATLAIDGVKACLVDDDGWGGNFTYTWLSKDPAENKRNEAKLRAVARDAFINDPENADKNPDDPKSYLFSYDDTVIAGLCDAFETIKAVRRKAKKQTLVKLPSDPKGSYGVWNTPFSPAVKAGVLKSHPTAIFLNEAPESDWMKIIQSGTNERLRIKL